MIAEGMSGRAGSASLELLTSSLECCAEWFKLGTGGSTSLVVVYSRIML